MWPWEHFALGYVLASLCWRVRGRRLDGRAVAAVGLGTQFPDLVDKTVAWGLGVVSAPRSLTHTMLVALPLSALVVAAAARGRWPVAGPAFVIGYLSHLAGDALPRLLSGYYGALSFLLWPLLPPPPHQGMTAVVSRLGRILTAPSTHFLAHGYRSVFVVATLLLWIADGLPGPAEVGRYVHRSLARNEN